MALEVQDGLLRKRPTHRVGRVAVRAEVEVRARQHQNFKSPGSMQEGVGPAAVGPDHLLLQRIWSPPQVLFDR